MAYRTRVILVFLATSIVFCAAATLRIAGMGVLIWPLGQADPSGIGLSYRGMWKVWNLWPTPVDVKIAKQTCACISSDTGNGPLPFARSRTISVTVSALNKGRNFQEKALLTLTRGKAKINRLLTVNGSRFAGLAAWPDAIKVPTPMSRPYSELVKLRFHRSIPFSDISVKTAENANLNLNWVSQPFLSEDSVYAQATLEVTVGPNKKLPDQLVFSIKGKPVRKIKIF
jgi:hypothetical protein